MKNRGYLVIGVLAVALALVALPGSASAGPGKKELRVGPGQQYATIQGAVHAAKPGDKIVVYPGTYEEDVFVLKDHLEIVAKGDGVDVVPTASPAAFSVFADHVTIRGFRIGFGGSNLQCAVGIYFEGSHNRFADNFFYQADSCLGINVLASRPNNGGSNFNVIEHNTIFHADLGIIIDALAPDAVNRGNVIRDNIILEIYTTPIGIANAVDFEISGNRIDRAARSCILVGTMPDSVMPQGHHTIARNTMGYCGEKAIRLYTEPGGDLSHNRIIENAVVSGCGGSCIGLEPGEGGTVSHNEVAGNTIVSAQRNGVFLWPGADHNRILRNDVSNSQWVGILVEGDDNLIERNCAYDNVLGNFGDGGNGNTWRRNTCGPKTK
jgi:nitrous oxidase accessory protein